MNKILKPCLPRLVRWYNYHLRLPLNIAHDLQNIKITAAKLSAYDTAILQIFLGYDLKKRFIKKKSHAGSPLCGFSIEAVLLITYFSGNFWLNPHYLSTS